MDLNVLGIIAVLATILGVGVALARMIHVTTTALDGKIDAGLEKLDAKLGARIEKLDTKLDAKIEKLDGKIDAVHRELVETRVALTDRAARLEGALLGVSAPEAAKLRAAAESA